MNKRDFIAPVVMGIISLAIVIFFRENILGSLAKHDLSQTIFNFSSVLFGLILTAYAMLFGVIPSLNKDYREWDVLEDINEYFLWCLAILLIDVVLSFAYIFFDNYILFSIIFCLSGISIGFFGYSILLLKDIFNFVSHEGSS